MTDVNVRQEETVAYTCAGRIKDYWRSQGVEVDTRVVKTFDRRGNPIFSVKTNIVNGLPPGVTPSSIGGRING